MKNYREECAKKFKALYCLQSAVTEGPVFTRISACETAKAAWDKLKEEFQGSERTRQMQVLNLRREFEALRMKDADTIQEYSDRLMLVVNQIRLLGEELTEKRIVEKVLISLPERFESKISSLEDSKDLTQISLSELVNALKATEQRRSLRTEENVAEGAFVAKHKGHTQASPEGMTKDDGKPRNFTPCSHCKKTNHSEKYCWFRPGVQCRACKKFGHVEKVCKDKQEQQTQQAQVAEKEEEEEETLFAATCYAGNHKSSVWIIDSGCSNHMTHDASLFKNLDKSYNSRVKLGNGEYIEVKEKGAISVETYSGTKYITNVLYVPKLIKTY